MSTPKTAGPKADYDFSKSQPWVKTARNLTFLDETKELMSIYDHDPDELEIDSALHAEDTSKPMPRSVPEGYQEADGSRGTTQSVPGRSNSTGHLEDIYLSSPAKRRRLTSSNSYNPSPTSIGAIDLIQSPSVSWHAEAHTGWTPSSATDLHSEPLTFVTSPQGLQNRSPEQLRPGE